MRLDRNSDRMSGQTRRDRSEFKNRTEQQLFYRLGIAIGPLRLRSTRPSAPSPEAGREPDTVLAAPAPSAAAPLSARDLEESSPPPAASGLCHLSAALCLSSSSHGSSSRSASPTPQSAQLHARGSPFEGESGRNARPVAPILTPHGRHTTQHAREPIHHSSRPACTQHRPYLPPGVRAHASPITPTRCTTCAAPRRRGEASLRPGSWRGSTRGCPRRPPPRSGP